MHDKGDKLPVDFSLYLAPYLRIGPEGRHATVQGGFSATGTLSAELDKQKNSMDVNIVVGGDSSASASNDAVNVSPSGHGGIGIDFTIKISGKNDKALLYLYPEGGVAWQQGYQTTAAGKPGYTTASSVQYYLGVGVATDRLGVPFVGLYVGITTQTWHSFTPPLAPTIITPNPLGVLNVVMAY